MLLAELKRYGSQTPIYVNLSYVSTIEPYKASYDGSKLYFKQSDIPLYIHETPEVIFKLATRKGLRIITPEGDHS